MTWLKKRRTDLQRDETGSITPFVVVIALVLFVAIGLAVDGGGKVRALQKADAAAAQAARAGGQAIQVPTAVQGDGAVLDPYEAKQAAQQYLAQAGVTGTVEIINGTRLRVRTTTHYSPVFLGMVGVGTQTTTGEAEVRLVEGIGGQEY